MGWLGKSSRFWDESHGIKKHLAGWNILALMGFISEKKEPSRHLEIRYVPLPC